MTQVVNSFNEWDPLEEVIVGTCIGGYSMSAEHKHDPVLFNLVGSPLKHPGVLGRGAAFDKDIIEKAESELDNLARVLQMDNVKVRRPDKVDFSTEQSTPDWKVPNGACAACPRDTLIVFGNEIVEAPMSMRARIFEFRAYRNLVHEYWTQGAKWTSAPKPRLTDLSFVPNYPEFDSKERLEEIAKGNYGLTEVEPLWDAADFLRMGKDIIGQVSLATNKSGIDWVRKHIGPQYRVHTMPFNTNRPRHIDDTLMCVRPGIVLSNSEVEPFNNGLDLFRKSDWRVIKVAPSKVSIPAPKGFYYESGGLVLNFLSIDENTVVIEEKEKDMIAFMESLGCRVRACPLSHVYFVGGSSHCATLDVRRRGGLQSYFPHLDTK